MRIFVVIICLIICSCDSKNRYQGQSAWAKYNDRINNVKRPVKSSNKKIFNSYKINPQKVTSFNRVASDLVVGNSGEADKLSSSSIHNDLNIENNNVVKEEYFSAAGSKCVKERKISGQNIVKAQVKCVYPDGREVNYNDLTI